MKEQQIEWDPPLRVSNENAQPGVNGARTPLAVAKGRWCSCDVYIIAPASWIQGPTAPPIPDGMILELCSLENGIETIIAQAGLSNLPLQQDSSGNTVFGKVFSVRGHPTTGFTVRAVGNMTAPSAATGPNAIVRIECWGEDASEARAIGASPFSPRIYFDPKAPTPTTRELDYPIETPPLELAVMMGNDATTGRLALVRVDATGAIVTSATSSSPLSPAQSQQTGTAPTGGLGTPLASAVPTVGIILSNDDTSTGNLYVGSSNTATLANYGIKLAPGDAVFLQVAQATTVYLNSDTGATTYRAYVE